MISDEVRQAGLTALTVAAAMLVEDAHEALIVPPQDQEFGQVLAVLLGRLGDDLTALANAAVVYSRRDQDQA